MTIWRKKYSPIYF